MIARTFFLALNTGYVAQEAPSEEAVEFYRERSGNGLYCAIVGNVVTPAGFGTNDVCMRISRSQSWRRLSQAIKGEGAKPGIQLSNAWSTYRGMRSFVARKVSDPINEYRTVIAGISAADVGCIFEDLTSASQLAVSAGFEHVQLHAAHGYLFSLLVDPFFCDHHELAMSLIDKWAREVRALGVETSIRVSLTTGSAACDGAERFKILERLAEVRVDVVDVSDGFYNVDKHLIYPSRPEKLSLRHNATISLAQKYPDRRFILSGKARPESLALTPNLDIGICRDLIANPLFLRSWSNGCENSMKCHFFSRGMSQITCSRWPAKL
jgi:2,4-dienoyl-CoA reductase-like NADH-dependent reductase (Old Yellow Enzyme family)